MTTTLVPVYFRSATDPDFVTQLNKLKELFAGEVEFLEPTALGRKLPRTDGVIFPQMLGDAYRRVSEIQNLPQPVMVVTSEFGTVSMWDWEIISYLTAKGIKILAPNTPEKTRQACRAMALRRRLKTSKFLVYQDNPASEGGNQDDIFKRFYWWEPECIQTIEGRYGLKVIKKSFRELSETSRRISDDDARLVWKKHKDRVPIARISERQVLSAMKVYMKVKEDLDADADICSVGINCLNESRFSDTTPCLAWNLLHEERKMVWGCEADLVTMLTELLIAESIGVPYMMTNLYPFLMGNAALKHEHIPNFPNVIGDPKDYLLAAHCGFLGVVPQSFSTKWTLQEKVLAIVNDNATAIDARLPEGPVTLVKLKPPFDRWSVIEGEIEKYVQYSDSHCLNGAVIRVPNGPKMVDEVISHHYIITTGHNLNAMESVSKVFDLKCETI